MKVTKSVVLVVVLLAVQTSFVARVPLFGARADLMVVAAIAAGIVGGAETGAVVGFAAGLAFDTLLPTPLGMSALAYAVVGYCCGLVQDSVLRAAWWIPVATAAVAGAGSALLFWVLGNVLSQPLPDAGDLPTIVAVIAAVSAVVCLPLVRAFRFALAEATPDRFHNDRFSMR